jgi:hypothetical protein
MLKSWRNLSYGALLSAAAIANAGCMSFGGGCNTCQTAGPACGPGPCQQNVCEQGCQPACGPRCGFLRRHCLGCGGCFPLCGWLHRRSNAIPDTLPLGKINEAWYYEMQTNAEASDFVLHDLDFVGQTTELTPDGKDHILEIAARMRSAPFPVLIERAPNNADPELDMARRTLVTQVLCDLGNPDATQRVVVATDYGPGFWSPQAQRMYYRHVQSGMGGGYGGNGGGMGGGAGFGQFGGGGMGYGY